MSVYLPTTALNSFLKPFYRKKKQKKAKKPKKEDKKEEKVSSWNA